MAAGAGGKAALAFRGSRFSSAFSHSLEMIRSLMDCPPPQGTVPGDSFAGFYVDVDLLKRLFELVFVALEWTSMKTFSSWQFSQPHVDCVQISQDGTLWHHGSCGIVKTMHLGSNARWQIEPNFLIYGSRYFLNG